MGLGALFTRDVKYTAVNTTTGESQSWGVSSDLVRDFGNSDYNGGMGLPGAWRAARLRSSMIGGFPWHAYRERAGKPAQKLPPQPLLEQPDT